MPIDAGLAELSNNLLVGAIVTYAVAMIGYTAEWAFGGRGTIGVAATAPARALVTAGAPSPDADPPRGAIAGLEPAIAPQAGDGRAARFGRFAYAVTVLGALFQVGSIVSRGLATERVPWGNMYEFVSVVCLAGVVAWLVTSAARPIRHLGLFVLLPVVLLLGLAGTVLYAKAAPLQPALNSYWLAIHVSTIAMASGIFLLGGVLAILHLVRNRYDVRTAADAPVRFPVSLGRRLPAADSLERLTFRVHAFAFPLWTFAVIAGAIWAEAAWGRYWGWDPKEVWAFVSWVVYAAYLHARATAGWRGPKATTVALIGWATMLVNLFVINFVVSGLHSYAGV